MHCEGLEKFDSEVWQEGYLLPQRKGLEAGLPPPCTGGAQSLYAKATLSHGHGHLCGDPSKGDCPQTDGK